jgi:hypothetical protein
MNIRKHYLGIGCKIDTNIKKKNSRALDALSLKIMKDYKITISKNKRASNHH